MDDKLKIFWNLEVLVKMSRSKNDGPSLRIEELEIETKIKNYKQEIEEIQSISEEENYDTSAEMADRNIEIITKKQIQVLRSELKEKNRELNDLKKEESTLYEKTNLLRENKISQEKYIESMQERVSELVGIDVLDRYNGLIAETTEKVNQLADELDEESSSYTEVQEKIIEITEKIKNIEEEMAKKKSLLSETQAHLEHKENYIDKTKTEKNAKRIADLENKIEKLENRLEVLRKDPTYLESKIKDVINNKESKKKAKQYLVDLINQVISIPYINVPTDNLLEEELLRATQARDSFANEIDQKTYNILEADTPEKLRIEYLTERINKWREELEDYNRKISEIDNDEQYNYERKERILSVMINSMKNDVKEFERAYEEIPDTNIGTKSSLKAALDEKKEDLIEAEKIATLFRRDEANDIALATRTIKYECDQINKNIASANEEIQKITNRLTSKKSGLIDISSRNKDKDLLKEIAQIVIDIKHRRQFPETPIEIVSRLEEDLNINLKDSIDMLTIEHNSEIVPKNYEEYYTKNIYNIDETDVLYNYEPDEDETDTEIDSDNSSTKLDEFNNSFDKLINDETEESLESPVEEVIPTEDEIIDKDIDDFYQNNTLTIDKFDEPIETEENNTSEEQIISEDIEATEEPIVPEDLIVEEEPLVEETPEIEDLTPTEEIPIIEDLTPLDTPVVEDIVEDIVEPTEYQLEDQEPPVEEPIIELSSDTPYIEESTPTEPITTEENVESEQPDENNLIDNYENINMSDYEVNNLNEPEEITVIPEEQVLENQSAEPSLDQTFTDETEQVSEEYQINEEEQQPVDEVVSTPLEPQEYIENPEEVVYTEPIVEEPIPPTEQPIDTQEQVNEQSVDEPVENYEEPTYEVDNNYQENEITNETSNLEPYVDPSLEPVVESTELQPEQTYQDISNDEYIDISQMITNDQVTEEQSEQTGEVIELSSDETYNPFSEENVVIPTVETTQTNNGAQIINTNTQNSDNIFSSENIEQELDNYINDLQEQSS